MRPDGSPSRTEGDARAAGTWRGGVPLHGRSLRQGGCVRGEHAVIPMAMPARGGGDQGRHSVQEPGGVRESAVCPRGPGYALAWLSSPFQSRASMRAPGVSGEARPELVEEPPRSPTGASWLCGLRRDEPGPSPRPAVPTKPQCSKGFAPSCNAPHPYYQRCWTPAAFPPPITQGQRLSVGLSLCGILQSRGGSWAFPRTSGIGLRGPSGPSFALSGRPFSLGRPGVWGRSPQAAKIQP